MKTQFPLFSRIGEWLTNPVLPVLSLGITETHVALVGLRHQRGEFEPRQSAVLRLPAGLVKPSFSDPNISDEAQMLDLLTRLMQQAGLKRIGKLSVSLPSGSARSFVVSLDTVPTSANEMAQLLEWKVERTTGLSFSQLRSSHRRIRDVDGKPHWVVSVAQHHVLDQYESVFGRLGWRTGLIVPQSLGEVTWLTRDDQADDQMLVSPRSHGFDVVIVRGSDPILIREVECAPEEVDDEFHRLVIFYRDRLLPEGSQVPLSRLLTIGTPAEQQRFRDLAAAALERSVVSLTPGQVGLQLDPGLSFSQVAAAAGLSSLAWSGGGR